MQRQLLCIILDVSEIVRFDVWWAQLMERCPSGKLSNIGSNQKYFCKLTFVLGWTTNLLKRASRRPYLVRWNYLLILGTSQIR